MSSDSSSRWKEVSDRLQLEKRELEREMDRQRMLDDLQASRTRNYELEAALAKLARDQDRLVLAERERILKRAQVAQATALMVQEANWAKNRMENEIRMSKERLRLFPEPGILELGSKFKPGRQPSLFPASTAPTIIEALVERPSQPLLSEERIATSELTPVISVPAVGDLVSSIADQVSEATASVTNTTAKIGDAFSSGYTGMISTFAAAVQSVQDGTIAIMTDLPTSTNEPPDPSPQPQVSPPVVAAPSPAPIVEPIKNLIPAASTGSLFPPQRTAAQPASTVNFPGRPDIKREAPTRVIQQRTKGQWTDSNLQTQATIILEQLIHERDLTIQNNPKVMERMYGIPTKVMVSDSKKVAIQREWLTVADAWLQSISEGKSASKLVKGKSKIDSVIADLANDEPPVEHVRESEPPEDPVVTSSAAPRTKDDEDKKKKCIIM